MRKRLLPMVLGALVLSACVGRPPESATGREIYSQLCSNCHGDNLEGLIGPPLGAGSPSASLPDEFLHFTITQGRGRMPSFATSLDDSQMERLISYIRQVQAS